MTDTIEQAKSSFLQAKERMCRALATTPDDRINWSPAPTARTPVQLVAHAAEVVKGLHETLDGQPIGAKNLAAADQSFREAEREFTTREAVLSLLEENSAAYIAWLEALTPDRLGTIVQLPFGFGQAPISGVIPFQAHHMNGHTAQIDYIQTIYGDRDWHMG